MGKVATFFEDGPTRDVVVGFDKDSGRNENFERELCDGCRDGDVEMLGEREEVIGAVEELKVESHRRRNSVGGPVDHNVGEEIIH